jgi:hypothetical protein
VIEARDRFRRVCDEVKIFHSVRGGWDWITDEISDLESASDVQLSGIVVIGYVNGLPSEFHRTAGSGTGPMEAVRLQVGRRLRPMIKLAGNVRSEMILDTANRDDIVKSVSDVYQHIRQAGRRQLSERNVRDLVATGVLVVMALLLVWYVVAARPTVPAMILALIVVVMAGRALHPWVIRRIVRPLVGVRSLACTASR